MKLFFSVILLIFTYTASLAQSNSLNYYLDVAKTNSPLLKDLRNQIASNQIDSMRIKAGLRPQVAVNSAGLYAPVINGYGYSAAITNEHTLNGLLGVNQAIVGSKNVNEQVLTVSLQTQTFTNTIKISEQDLKKSITAQYITAYGSLQQYDFNKEIVDLLAKEDEVLKKLTRANVYRQSDYLSFLVTLKQAQLQLSQSRAQYKNDYATLNYLAGVTDTAMIAIAKPDIEKTVKVSPAQSIFFNQFKVDSLKLINSRRLLDFTYKPKINALADVGFNSDFTGQEYKNFGLSAGFTLSIPIYDGGQRKLAYKKLNLQEDTRQNYKTFFDMQYRQQRAQLNQQITENEALLAQVTDQMKYIESLIKVDTQLMQTGDLKIADLILAINNYLAVKNLFTQTTITGLQLTNQLNYWNK
ncbi:TolC family protein [Mucilaginibacter corticis]|uniref:TolC family protein n=1 Tax=Mucilaginibacter corticis TaxID=2597670 RepID=A0A556MFY7_9SPHI|nr:TolC family protein [Mucilaginibacter corticis]TSJ38759.1 TolC family protein [Mucilaginibacter corticis]